MEQTTAIAWSTATPRYGRALVWGVAVAAVVGLGWWMLVWAVGDWIGAPAAVLGAGVGYGVLLGSGRHRGRWAQAAAVVITLAGMLVVAALGMRIVTAQAGDELRAAGIEHLPLLPHWRMYWNLAVGSFAADVTTLVFFGVGLWVAINAPRRFETYD